MQILSTVSELSAAKQLARNRSFPHCSSHIIVLVYEGQEYVHVYILVELL